MNPSFRFSRSGIIALAGVCGILTASFFPASSQAGTQNDPPNTGSSNLQVVSSGSNNTALGFDALTKDTTGSYNTGAGHEALVSNTTGDFNTATGSGALYHNTDGSSNTATGLDALFYNTTGDANTATGLNALVENSTGSNNTATGLESLYHNGTGWDNTATGFEALYANTSGTNNTANGVTALYANSTGVNNTAVGYEALLANTSGSLNIALGMYAGASLTTGSMNIDIGNHGAAGESNTIRIGNDQTATYIGGIDGASLSSASGEVVYIDVNGRLGTALSSNNIDIGTHSTTGDSNTIRIGGNQTATYISGIAAANVGPSANYVVINNAGRLGTIASKISSIDPLKLNSALARLEESNARLEASNAKMEKRDAKLEAINSKLETAFALQQHEIKDLTASLKEQASLLQKVSAQMAVSRPEPQVVSNNN